MIAADLTLARLFAQGAGELRVKLDLATGSLTALVGPSGSGKTSLLRLLAGLETPTQGYIEVNGVRWLDTETGVNLRPQQRSVGYIFQESALFPNLTVRENILFVTPKGEQELAGQLIESTGLGQFSHQKPNRLSGGQQQRVALARALVRRPHLLLLDEPFAALDAVAAGQLREVLRDLHRSWGTTTLLVSHQDADVYTLADRVLHLVQGQLQEAPTGVRQPPRRELIRRVWFDSSAQQWVVDLDTVQLRSDHPAWGQLTVGSVVDVSPAG